MYKISKKTQEMLKLFDSSKSYSIRDAIDILRQFEKFRGFQQSVEMVIDMEKTKDSKSNRFTFNLMHGLPQDLKILAIVNSTMEKKLKAENTFSNLQIGGEEMLDSIIKTGKSDLNSILCTPEMFQKITKHARVLGQLRLMPSAKTGTVLEDIMSGVRSLLLGTIQKVKKYVNTLTLKIANCNFKDDEIIDNFTAVLDGIKNEFGGSASCISSISIKLSMSPAVRVSFN